MRLITPVLVLVITALLALSALADKVMVFWLSTVGELNVPALLTNATVPALVNAPPTISPAVLAVMTPLARLSTPPVNTNGLLLLAKIVPLF